MEFYLNTATPHQVWTLDESSNSHGAEIQGEMETSGGNFGKALQSCRPEEPRYLDSFKSGIRFRGSVPHRSTAANQMSPSSCTKSTPWEATLSPTDIQDRMQPYAVGLSSQIDNLLQSLPTTSTKMNSYHHIVDPRETNLMGISSYVMDIPRDIPIRPPGENAFHSRPTGSTNMIPNHLSVDSNEMDSKGIPTNAMDIPRDVDPYRVGNSREKDPNGTMSSHTTYPREEYLGGIQSDQMKSPEEVRATMVYLIRENNDGEERNFHQETQRENSQFIQPRQSFPLNQTCSKAGTSFKEKVSLPDGAPLYHAKPQRELTSQAYEKANKGGSNFINQTSSDGRIRSEYLPLTSQETTINGRGFIATCPRCHCVVASRPQPALSPTTLGTQNTRTSVIMLTQESEVQETKETSKHCAGGNQTWPSSRKRPLENDSDHSEEEKDDEELQEMFFRVNIDGTTARFKLTEEDWAKMPIKTFPSGGRLLSGDWTRIFLNKVKESNPWCSLRFKNNHVRSENSRKMHSSVFFRGGAECKYPECNVKLRFVIKKDYGRHVDVTYIGNVCHSSST